VALFAIWAVHNLTKGRDREKAVFDLYKIVSDATTALKPIVIKAWQDDDAGVRATAIAETNWRLQQIGGYVERIRRQSRRWGLRGIRSPRALPGAPYAPQDDTFLIAAANARATLSVARRALWMWARHAVWVPGWTIEIGLTKAMAALRNAITADPFSDPDRDPDKTKSPEVELIIGGFLQDMDLGLFAWMDRER
jgi:hypothetical protein